MCRGVSGPVVRPQLMVSNMLRGNTAPPGPRPNFPNPIQRPGLAASAPSGPIPPASVATQRGVNLGGGAHLGPRPMTQPQPSLGGTQLSNTVRAQQAKARQDLLAHCANFMNPHKTSSPGSKMPATTSQPASVGNGACAPPAAPKADGSGDGKKSIATPLLKSAPTCNTPGSAASPTALVAVASGSAGAVGPQGEKGATKQN